MRFSNYIFIFVILIVFSCKKDTSIKNTPANQNKLVWKLYSNYNFGFCNSTYIPIQYFGAFTLDKNNVAWFPVTSGIASFNQTQLTNYPALSDTSSGYILNDKFNNVWIS